MKYRKSELPDKSSIEEYTDANGNRLVARRSINQQQDFVEVFEHANGLKETRTTDAAQSRMKIENRNGKTLAFNYDSLRRRTWYSHATGERECAFEYRGNTNSVIMAANNNQLESVFVDYDEKGRVTRVRQKGWVYKSMG